MFQWHIDMFPIQSRFSLMNGWIEGMIEKGWLEGIEDKVPGTIRRACPIA